MPVLYALQPSPDLGPNAYIVLHMVTTQWIDKGILLRFVFYDGYNSTYADALTYGRVVQVDLLTKSAIPPATILQLNTSLDACTLQGVNGATVYSTVTGGISAQTVVSWGAASLLVFAFEPTTAYLSDTTTVTYLPDIPLKGVPQFAIGFSNLYPAADPGASLTAPNFPNEYSTFPDPWVFKYSVVYPWVYNTIAAPPGAPSADITGIKVQFDTTYPLLAVGSWSSLRTLLSQPTTYIFGLDSDDTLVSSPSVWQAYNILSGKPTDVGPFLFCAMPGQLAVTYFKPAPMDTATESTALPSYGPAEAAFLVTAPLPPNVAVYFTVDAYNSQFKGFGVANVHSGRFQIVEPSFTWVTPVTGVPAGTTVLITGIGGGSSTIRIVDARGILDVGSIVRVNHLFTLSAVSVTSLIVLGLWQYSGVGTNVPVLNTNFVTAALSDQYGGDLPVLAPGVTLPLYVFTGPAVYGYGRIFNCACLAGPVQAVMINNADFTQLDVSAPLDPSVLPIFEGMCSYRF